jgi:hypothetical protein
MSGPRFFRYISLVAHELSDTGKILLFEISGFRMGIVGEKNRLNN